MSCDDAVPEELIENSLTRCGRVHAWARHWAARPQQCLYFLPLPHGQGWLHPTLGLVVTVTGTAVAEIQPVRRCQAARSLRAASASFRPPGRPARNPIRYS